MQIEKSLLIIEKDPSHAYEIQHDIHTLFKSIHIVNSVSESEAALDNNNYDIVIVNPFFSDGHVRTFVEELHKKKKLNNTPIVVVSSLPAEWVKEDFYYQGAHSYFEMPYDKEEFYRTLQEMLQRVPKHEVKDGSNAITGFSSREKFEQDYKRNQKIVEISEREGILGIISPDAIDIIIRNHGLETGDMLLEETARLVREMCCDDLQAVSWTHRSIVFAIMDKSLDIVQQGLEELRKKYIESIKLITGDEKTPGFHAILSPILPNISLDERLSLMFNKLISIVEDPYKAPIQFLTLIKSTKKYILISDPDEVSCSIIKQRTKRDGYIPICFSQISEVFIQVFPEDVAVILVDTIAKGGGINMVREIRSFDHLKDVPIIIMSRFGHENEIADAFNAGAQDYLLKPFSMIELSSRIKKLATR